jgi:hypothetical protein
MTTRGADTVRVRIEQRRCAGGACRWVTRTATTGAAAAAVAVRLPGRLRTGRYRAVAVARSAAGESAPATRRFAVRGQAR